MRDLALFLLALAVPAALLVWGWRKAKPAPRPLSRERQPVRREVVAGLEVTATPVGDVWDGYERERALRRRAG